MVHKTAVISGASRGIGRALALRLAKRGYQLALLARQMDLLEQVARQCETLSQQRAIAIQIDAQHHESLAQGCDEILRQFETVDVFINNHGMNRMGNILDDTHKMRALKILQINLTSSVYLTEKLLPAVVAAAQQRPNQQAIIYLGSVASRLTFGGSAAYCAAKHGVVGFAHSLFEEVRDYGIKVTTLCPGFVNTDLVGGLTGLDNDKMIQPEDVGEAVEFVLDCRPTLCPVEMTLRPQYSPYDQ